MIVSILDAYERSKDPARIKLIRRFRRLIDTDCKHGRKAVVRESAKSKCKEDWYKAIRSEDW